MSGVIHRAFKPEDLDAAVDVFLVSGADMGTRHGLAPGMPARAAMVPIYRHIAETGIFEVAEQDGKIVAVCHAIVRDHVWFLSGFWVLPGMQRQKLGGQMLRRALEEGRKRGATVAFTWSSVDLTAMATYMKMGMMPGFQNLTFAGAPGAYAGAHAASPDGYRIEALDLELAGELDRDVRATARREDHIFLSARPGVAKALLHATGPAGYFYAANGVIGPAAWTRPEHAGAVLAHALHEAKSQAPEVRMMVPGINHTALRFAFAAGLRLVAYSHHLTTAPFGKLDRYLSSGPSLY